MKQLTFEIGQRVKAKNLNLYAIYNGHNCIVVKELGTHEGTDEDGVLTHAPDCYQVVFVSGQKLNVSPRQLDLAMPHRGDMDTKVLWDDMPYQRREEDLT